MKKKKMRHVQGYDSAEAYENFERLPIGGYVLKILNVEYLNTDYGDKILLSFDITEGEYAGFYNKNYHAQNADNRKWKGTYRLSVPDDYPKKGEEWKIRSFKSRINDFEKSNPGFHWDWDEQKLKGKLIGGIFNEKEYDYDGRQGFYTRCYYLTSTDKIRSGNFKIPEATLLKNSGKTKSIVSDEDPAWMNVPEDVEELPFD